MLEKLNTGTPLPAALRITCAVVIAGLFIALAIVIVVAGEPAAGLQAAVTTNLERSGVKNPVTAVLLNFRGYDTLLEIAVLFIVVAATIPNIDQSRVALVSATHGTIATSDAVLFSLVRLLVPVIVLLAAYMLWVGAHAPGGAFQAGALLAAAGVLLSLVGRHRFAFDSGAARFILVAGLLLFTLVGAAVTLNGGAFLQYPPAYAGALILLIEAAASVSIAATLLLLYVNLAQAAAAPLCSTQHQSV